MNLMNPSVFQAAATGLSRTLGTMIGAHKVASLPKTRPHCLHRARADKSSAYLLRELPETPTAAQLETVAGQLCGLTWNWLERMSPNCRRDKLQAEATLKRALARLSPESFCHSVRVAHLASKFVVELGLDRVDGALHQEMRLAGILHDIGKLCLPLEILEKPGRLTNSEYTIVQLHPVLGEMLLRDAGLHGLAPAVRSHHERWDGRGYPDHKPAGSTPLAARIIALADSYDAMTGLRPYRKPATRLEAVGELRAGAGGQFDPELVERFVAMILAD